MATKDNNKTKYYLYIDECGDQNLEHYDPNLIIFAVRTMGSFPTKKHFACESNDFMDRILRLKRVVFLTALFLFPIKRVVTK